MAVGDRSRRSNAAGRSPTVPNDSGEGRDKFTTGGVAIRMKDWNSARLLLPEYRRLEGMLDRQAELF